MEIQPAHLRFAVGFALLALGVAACSDSEPESGADSGGSSGSQMQPATSGANSGGASSGAGNGGVSSGGSSSGGTTSAASSGASFGGAASSGSHSGGSASGGAASGGAITGGTSGVGGSGGTSSAGSPFKGVANSDCADLTTLGVTWWYNWTLSPGSCKTPEFVPMISGKNEKTAGAVTSALNNAANAGYRTVLGFNEPNKTDQSNLTVAQVIELWPSITAKPEIRIGSPATSADAKAWFTDFMTQVDASSLRVDFVAIHWYGWNAGSCNNANELENYIKWAETFKRPLWLTEWGCMNQSNPNPEVVTAFYSAAIAMFAKHPMLERYAWYPWNTNNGLMNDAHMLTALGEAFMAASGVK